LYLIQKLLINSVQPQIRKGGDTAPAGVSEN
jgi:hypothetical protein